MADNKENRRNDKKDEKISHEKSYQNENKEYVSDKHSAPATQETTLP